MENSSVIKLHFPQKHERHANPAQAHPLKVKEWLDNLPLENNGETARLVYQELTTLNRSTIPAQHRLQILEFFRAPVQHVTAELKKHYLGAPLPLTGTHLKAAHLSRELHMEMASGYKIIIDNLITNNATASMMLIHLHRAISYLGRVVLTSYQMYATCPPTVWHDIHQIYRYAEQKKLHESPMEDHENPVSGSRSIGAIYKQCLLLALTNPYQLSQEGITDIYMALSGDWPLYSGFTLIAEPHTVSGAFIVNLARDEPPSALAYGKDSQMELCSALDTTDLVDYLHQLANGVPEQPIPGSLTETTVPRAPALAPGLLRWLISAWGIVSRRTFPRLRKTGAFNVAIGLQAAYHFAVPATAQAAEGRAMQGHTAALAAGTSGTGGGSRDTGAPRHVAGSARESVASTSTQSFAKPLVLLTNPAYNGAEKSAVTRGNSVRGDYFKRPSITTSGPGNNPGEKNLAVKFPGHEITPATYTCTVVNESAGGACLAWKGDNQQKKFRTGEIISIKIANGKDPAERELAVIRWTRNAASGELEFGIQMLAPTAEAVFVRTLMAERNGEPAIAALLLPEVKDDNQSISLITPANAFPLGAEITISMHCGTRHALLTETLESTVGFTQYRFMPVQTADEILTSIHQTHDGDFANLWAAL